MMSELTHRLETSQRPSRALCVEAAARIKELEDALIEAQKIAMGIGSSEYPDVLAAVSAGLRGKA